MLVLKRFLLILLALGFGTTALAADVCVKIRTVDSAGNPISVPLTDGRTIYFGSAQGITRIIGATLGTYRLKSAVPGIVLSPSEAVVQINQGDTVSSSCGSPVVTTLQVVSSTGLLRVSGSARSASGQPVAGVRLTFQSSNGHSSAPPAITDSAGNYSILLPRGSYQYSISSPDSRSFFAENFSKVTVSAQDVTGINVREVPLTNNLTISGTITDSQGRPASVPLSVGDNRWFASYEADGAFVISGLAPGTYTLTSRAGYTLAQNGPFTLTAQSGSIANVSLRIQSRILPHYPTIRLLTSSGQPIAGRSVSIEQNSNTRIFHLETDSAGEAHFTGQNLFDSPVYRVSVAPALNSLVLPGATADLFQYEVDTRDEQGDGPELIFTNSPQKWPNRATGYVRFTDGSPVSGAFLEGANNDLTITNPDGSYSLALTAEAQNIRARQCYGSTCPIVTNAFVAASDPVAQDFQLPDAPVRVHYVIGYNGAPYPSGTLFSAGQNLGVLQQGVGYTTTIPRLTPAIFPLTLQVDPMQATPIPSGGFWNLGTEFTFGANLVDSTTTIRSHVYLQGSGNAPGVLVSEPILGSQLTDANGYANFSNAILGQTYHFTLSKENMDISSFNRTVTARTRPFEPANEVATCISGTVAGDSGNCVPIASLPAVVASVAAEQIGANVHLTWPAAPNATDYTVYRDSLKIAEGITALEFTDTTINVTGPYDLTYRIKSHNSYATSGFSPPGIVTYTQPSSSSSSSSQSSSSSSSVSSSSSSSSSESSSSSSSSTNSSSSSSSSSSSNSSTGSSSSSSSSEENCSVDSDGDGTPDCIDKCPADPLKTQPNDCGCGISEVDLNKNGISDCLEDTAGVCLKDSDQDGVPDCKDGCPFNTFQAVRSVCGCAVRPMDLDGDGVADCAQLHTTARSAKRALIRNTRGTIRVEFPSFKRGTVASMTVQQTQLKHGKRSAQGYQREVRGRTTTLRNVHKGDRLAVSYHLQAGKRVLSLESATTFFTRQR